MEPWFIRYPDHYFRELKALNDLDISYTEDEKLKHDKGILRLTLTIKASNPHFNFTGKGHNYTLIVVYPDSYPWFRPQVYAYELSLPRHQHLLGKNLCLLPRTTRFWYTEQTVAHLLQAQLATVLEKGIVEDPEIVRADPQEQAEPVSEYFPFMASVLFDPEVIPVAAGNPAFEILGKMTVGLPEGAPYFSRMAVKDIQLCGGKIELVLPAELQRLFPRSLTGTIVRTPTPPPADHIHGVIQWLRKGLGERATRLDLKQRLTFREGVYTNLVAVTFPEEVQKGVEGSGWMFLVDGPTYPRNEQNKPIDGKSLRPVPYFAKPAYISMDAKRDRVPRLVPLGKKKVAVVGLGALGGYTALELARSGVQELRILDFDTVDAPTTVRWPLGLTAAGLFKVEVLQKFIRENYPSTQVLTEKWRLGDLRIDGNREPLLEQRSEPEILEQFLDGVDLLIDATAEEGINNFLSRQAYLKSLPYICLYATPGAWGGVVMRYLPGSTGCWSCMKQWQRDNPEELVPPSDDQGEIQPPGCGDLTFTGAGFDLQNVSLAGVRLAVSTLCRGENGGYADVPWDWAVLRLVDDRGAPVSPQWKTQPLAYHPNCPYHGGH